MKALTDPQAYALALACSGTEQIVPSAAYAIARELEADGLMRFFEPEVPGCTWGFEATEAGERALRVHAAFKGW